MAIGNTFFDNEGKSVTLPVTATVEGNQIAVVSGWLGITANRAESGENVALTIDRRGYQLQVPTALAAEVGDTIYIDLTDLTGHTPDSTAYSKSAGAGKKALLRVTEAQDANDWVIGILLPEGV